MYLKTLAGMLALATMLVVVILVPAPANAGVRCFGREPTIVASGQNRVIGTPRPDVILGTGQREIIFGRGGADRICARGGNDDVVGMGGADQLNGEGGRDLLAGDAGNDIEIGGAGADVIYGGAGSDRMIGSAGLDFLLGNDGSDDLFGSAGFDRLFGQSGDDLLNGGPQFDLAAYGFARNGIRASLVTRRATGEGTDRLRSIEDLLGSDQNDDLTGDGGVNFFYPGLGNDTVDGRPGFDLLSFYDSENSIVADVALGSASGQGDDTFRGIEDLTGSNQGDQLSGDDRENLLQGLNGPDELFGLGEDDYLDGGVGNDDGDGGDDGTNGDFCESIEVPTNCEHFVVAAAGRRAAEAEPRRLMADIGAVPPQLAPSR
jgi:Ca2+-binding RTX toxin-like protein